MTTMAIDNNNNKILNVPALRFLEFSGEWKTVKIGTITTKVGSGVTPRGGETVYRSQGHPFVRSQNVGWGRLLLNDIAYIDEETHKKQLNTALELNDILLNITGASIGRCAVVNKMIVNGNVNQHVCIIRSNEAVDPEFLCNYLLSNYGQKQIDSFQAGGNRQGLNFEQIKSIRISIPTLDEQKYIAKLLFAINQRIETQNKIIEDLKKLKSAIIHRCYSSQINMVSLSELIKQCSERNHSGMDLQVLSVSNKHGFIAQSEQFEDREVASDDTSNYKVVKKDMFAYNPARINVGSIALYEMDNNGIVSPMYVCFTTKSKLSPNYLKHYFTSQAFRHEMHKRLEGSVRLCLTFEGLCNIEIPLPSIDQQENIGKYLSKIDNKISLEENVLSQYQMQRSYLLSEMFI